MTNFTLSCRSAVTAPAEKFHRNLVSVSGDTARSVCKARVLHVGADDRADRTYECCGNYLDELVRTPAGWRLRRRQFDVTISLGDVSVLQPG